MSLEKRCLPGTSVSNKMDLNLELPVNRANARHFLCEAKPAAAAMFFFRAAAF
jgi:hypothetical protein